MIYYVNRTNINTDMTSVYVLSLQDGKYYVGKSGNPTARIADHFKGSGAAWTKKYAPVSIVSVTSGDDEDRVTEEYMLKYGIDNVRGGTYCQFTLPADIKTVLQKKFLSAQNKCFKCGNVGHFVKQCPVSDVCARCGRNNHKENRCHAKTTFSGEALAPVAAPVDAPVATPVETPVVKPVETPVVTPASTPVDIPVAVLVTAAMETPMATPVTAGILTPVATPVATSQIEQDRLQAWNVWNAEQDRLRAWKVEQERLQAWNVWNAEQERLRAWAEFNARKTKYYIKHVGQSKFLYTNTMGSVWLGPDPQEWDVFGGVNTVTIQAVDKMYLSARSWPLYDVSANTPVSNSWEQWSVLGDIAGLVNFKSAHGKYLAYNSRLYQSDKPESWILIPAGLKLSSS